jgi:predicted DNA-binding transcriptional regulator YafY
VETDPTARTLRLLALLQARPRWSPTELAERLGVSTRTLRRDLRRLEDLDYRVESRPGPGGHYALGAGTRVPPLLFEDDEVLALILGLRSLEDRLTGDAAARALAKLVQVLPRRLGAVARTATSASAAVQRRPADLDLDVLASVIRAAAEDRSAELAHEDRRGDVVRRHVDSLLCLQSRGQWYALGFDLDRDDWRLFRVDRIHEVRVGAPTRRREGPAADLATWLATDFGRLPAGEQAVAPER